METVIEIKNLKKKYTINHYTGRYVALRDVFANIIQHPLRFLKQKTKIIVGRQVKEDFYALNGITLNVEKGSVIGVIGKNGAGKSTLFKILTGITPPTEGEIILRGKVASLLEVGTGFHPELSGRENIFLNGAILGMTKKEIESKFEEIVSFAGMEKFLDTPVKHYSSGMYMRLAFSVAAHMEPDILLVDEVLAVGDAEFQKKCLGKMEEVTKKAGRTVLFVSHNLSAIKSICTQCILLDKGKLEMFGPTNEVVQAYLEKISDQKTEWKGETKTKDVKLLHTWVTSLSENKEYDSGTDIEIGMEIEAEKDIDHAIVGMTLWSEYGYELAFCLWDDTHNKSLPSPLPSGRSIKRFIIPKNTLAHGTYFIEFHVGVDRDIIGRGGARDGDLVFALENLSGIGRQTKQTNGHGVSSLYRPGWGVTE
jgi:lipopolysaccharide transport system ATP-binding protein